MEVGLLLVTITIDGEDIALFDTTNCIGISDRFRKAIATCNRAEQGCLDIGTRIAVLVLSLPRNNANVFDFNINFHYLPFVCECSKWNSKIS